ncbi:hypothetical protein RugamoR64_06340 [Duganella rhizosphaerae]|uniref:hypothetical protein n=1 Tax=Duganella rhizosphaerae TaxID=2885763 RepID=UPI0030E88FEB
MKIIFFISLFFISEMAFCADEITLPAEGFSSAESIRNCESQLAKLEKYQKKVRKTTNGYTKIDPNSDSFIYVFTTSSEPAHPAMIKITLHRMADVRHPAPSEIETFGSYAGKEKDFLAWGNRVTYELGRGFGDAVNGNK